MIPPPLVSCCIKKQENQCGRPRKTSAGKSGRANHCQTQTESRYLPVWTSGTFEYRSRLSLPNRKRPCRSPLFPAWRDSWDTRLPRLRPFPNERRDAEEHFRYNCRTRRLTSTRKTKNRAWYGVPSRFCAKTVSSHLFQGLLAAMLQKILKWLWNGKTSPPKGIVEESNIIENTVNYRSENPI